LSQILIGYIAICAVRKGHHLTCPQANGESKVEHSPHIEDATKGTCYEGEREREKDHKTVINQPSDEETSYLLTEMPQFLKL